MINEIDWTKAPEGATHYGIATGEYVEGWYKILGNTYKFMRPHNKQWINGHNRIPEDLIPKPLQPVFTKVMFDDGETVKAGMLFSTVEGEYEALIVNDRSICFENEKGFLIAILTVNAKPIIPPIELIDSEFYGFEYSNVSYRGIYSKKEDRFIFSDGHVMASYCKSIKLLEVKS